MAYHKKSRRKRGEGDAASALLLIFAIVVIVSALTIATFLIVRTLGQIIIKGLTAATKNRKQIGMASKFLAYLAGYILFVSTAIVFSMIFGGSIVPTTILAGGAPLVGAAIHPCWNWIKSLPARPFKKRSSVDKRGLDPALWQKARQECFNSKGRKCLIRLRGCTKVATQIDHIRPLARGGDKYDQKNLQPSCRFCNLSKSTKLMSELPRRRWLGGRR